MEVNTTENKTLEQDYRDLAGLLSNIVDSLPIYFFVKDTGDNFRYVYSSPLMNQLYGRYHNDVVGKTDFDHFSTPETIYINKEQEKNTHMKVHAMMSSLTTRQREIVYYRYIKDMSIDEISKITDMNYQSVSNSIQRALGRVRNLFKRE